MGVSVVVPDNIHLCSFVGSPLGFAHAHARRLGTSTLQHL